MCRSKEDGGRRCARTPYKKSRANLLRKNDSEALSRLIEAHVQYGDDVRHLEMVLPDDTIALLNDLEDLGKPMIVGGSVRDACLGTVAPKDMDIEVHNASDYDALARGLKRKGYRVDEVGKAFGVIKTILKDGTDIDISLPRRDNLVGAGHRGFDVEVDPDMTLEQAASRRDFTINAMYYDHATQAVVDPHHGYDDLKNRVLRHVSDAYSEDPLRVLRGVQICSRFGLSMDESTVEASRQMVGEFHTLPDERIQQEWHKFFTRGQAIDKGLQTLKDTGWDRPMGIADVNESAGTLSRVLKEAKKADLDPSVLGAAVLLRHADADKRQEVAQRLVIGARNQREAHMLANAQYSKPRTAKDVRHLARRLDGDGLSIKTWSVAYEDRTAARLAKEQGCFEHPVSDLLTGREMLERSQRSGGRWVGAALKEMQAKQDAGELRSKEAAVQWFDEYLRNHG